MVAYFATDYTIHFDDTMAYGGHHFLTSFKFQCAAREAFLFGERIFDDAGVKSSLAQVHLLTADAYSRNLHSTTLGDRVAILLTLEEWGRASARFCYRVIDNQGRSICAGFQTLICADAKTGSPVPLPPALREAMDGMREIEEPRVAESFRDCVLAGGSKLDALFGDEERATASQFLSHRYPSPAVIAAVSHPAIAGDKSAVATPLDCIDTISPAVEAWVFAGQGAFDANLLSQRVAIYLQRRKSAREELELCAIIASEHIGSNAQVLIDGPVDKCIEAVKGEAELLQVAIHLQNVLGGQIRLEEGHRPSALIGHSFGEIAALGVGGCFDLATGVRMVCLRGEAIRKYAPPESGLLAILSSRHRVEIEATLLELDQVVVAGRNHDQQTIASGPIAQLEQLKRFFQSIGIVAVSIPSLTSFHHPQLRVAASSWHEQLRSIPFQQLSFPVYSPIGRRFIKPTDDIATVLASQLLRPFDLQGAISDLVATGITKFVDCGSTGSLAAILSKTCPDKLQICRAGEESEFAQFSPSDQSPNAKQRDSKIDKIELASEPVGLPVTVSDLSSHSSESHSRSVPSVAIVGRGCILPGGANSPKQLFASITEKRMGIVDQCSFDPYWSRDFYSETLVPDRSTSHLCGRIDSADIRIPAGVDSGIFQKFTRTQKLICIALSDCVTAISGTDRVVCLIGATADGFEDQDEASSLIYAGIDPSDPYVNQRMNSARSACRTPHDAVQEVFDCIVRPGLKVILIDAACASSLYTMALGMKLLETDQADLVIAGGVFCPGPGNSCLFSQFRGTTSTGCRPFDAHADGVVFSEGAALVALRRTVDAERLGMKIDATVLGAGLSSDGRSSSANVPQSHGQILSLQRCYGAYGIDPASIRAIEGHGTSTPVGDSTEVETLRQFFAEHATTPVLIHSLKGTLGHAGWAAGTASVIAVCEYLQRGVFPGQAFFRNPSNSLISSRGTLAVSTHPVSLSQKQLRIAIDGFGFGGANAHIVLEKHRPSPTSSDTEQQQLRSSGDSNDDALVVVAYHQLHAAPSVTGELRFDRDKIKLPKDFIVLPELSEDMDISQTLAVILTHQVVANLSDFDDKLHRETSLVLAMSGKTERGVEATTRVMNQRMHRNLGRHDQFKVALDSTYLKSRPSKAYTLQCMMPNVASGRAALLLNLNGPNFVVDSGVNSLEAAFSSAAMLLHDGINSGTHFAIVAAIKANSLSDPHRILPASSDEYAVVFGITTRSYAKQRGWAEILEVDKAIETLAFSKEKSPDAARTFAQVQSLVNLLKGKADGEMRPATSQKPSADESNEDCRLYTPVWVEKGSALGERSKDGMRAASFLAIVPANEKLVGDLVKTLPEFFPRFSILVVGDTSSGIASKINLSNVWAMSDQDIHESSAAFSRVDQFEPDVIAVFQTASSWKFLESLSSLANDNGLCETFFLLAQRSVKRLNEGKVELWSVLLDGWRGFIHPQSGPFAGLLKSVQREIPTARLGSICTDSSSIADALEALRIERVRASSEQEVVYAGRTRLVRRLRPTLSKPCVNAQAVLSADSVVVATGGGRGVTAVLLEAILRDHQCTIIALGKSPLEPGPENPDDVEVEQQFYHRFIQDNPNASPLQMKQDFEAKRACWEAHRTIQSLSALGGQVEYNVVDVTNHDQVVSAVEQIATRYGKIDLLVHGAGVQVSKRLEHRTLEDFRRTYGVKVAGLNLLVECCYSKFGRVVPAHVLTSAYSIFGNDGQHDYGAANETMDRLCEMSHEVCGSPWSSMAWLAWDGIGMTRGSEYRALAKQRNLSGINRELGQRLFREVISGRTGAVINVPVATAERLEYRLQTVPPVSESSRGKLIEVPLKLSSIDCLAFHKVRGLPTLPGAWVLDRLVHAAMQLNPNRDCIVGVEAQDLCLMRFVRDANGLDPNVRVIAEETDEGYFAWMVSDVLHPTGRILSKDVLCAKVALRFDYDCRPSKSQASALHFEKHVSGSPHLEDPYCRGIREEVELSGCFNCLGDIEIGRDSRQAKLVLAPQCCGAGVIPALALDAAWRVGAMYANSDTESLFVPVEVKHIWLPVEPAMQFNSISKWMIVSTTPQTMKSAASWDRTEVFGQDGKLKLIVEGATAKRIG